MPARARRGSAPGESAIAGSVFADVPDAGAPDAAPSETALPERPAGMSPSRASAEDLGPTFDFVIRTGDLQPLE
jgi:hypothetical protein